MRFAFYSDYGALLGACQNDPTNIAEFREHLRQTLKAKPTDSTRAFALIKNGVVGSGWLATIHGYADNKTVCEQLIEPYNTDPDLSTLPGEYFCDEI